MNFKYMPELNMKLAYPILWIIMILIVWLMLRYFRRKKRI
jgi:magnesium transporter